jgi:hypothetical protein
MFACFGLPPTNRSNELRQNRKAQIVELNSPFRIAHIVACNHILVYQVSAYEYN